jgi:flagellar biogenesis protein FliO
MGRSIGLLLAEASGQVELMPSGYGWALLKMLGALFLVCALAFFIFRFLGRHFAIAQAGGRFIRVLERCPLSSRQSLWVVEAGGRYFLLAGGEGPGGAILKLAELDKEALPSPATGAGSSFWEILHGGRGHGSPKALG